MRDGAGALLDPGKAPAIAYGRDAAAARALAAAERCAVWTIAHRQDCFAAEFILGRSQRGPGAPRNDERLRCHGERSEAISRTNV
jgi:hypothetical protein